MHVIRSATLRPGAAVTDADEQTSIANAFGKSRLIRGKALIFWDPTLAGTKYGKKRDAIDTELVRSGASTFVEVGPGNVLSGLVRRIDRGVKTISVNTLEGLERAQETLSR